MRHSGAEKLEMIRLVEDSELNDKLFLFKQEMQLF
jgi:hypothetical protein